MPYISDEIKVTLFVFAVMGIVTLVVMNFANNQGQVIYDRCIKTHTAALCNFVRQIRSYSYQEMTLACVDQDKFPVSVCYYLVGTP